ncbi:MAG TPA: DUF5994 family protein, partial [Pseudonocardiaceae bacterium]
MTPTSHDPTHDGGSRPGAPEAHGEARLRLGAGAATPGELDGAWWPRSRDLTAELPALAAALTGRLGQVGRVAYAMAAWEPAPRGIVVSGRRLRLDGFRTQDDDVVDVLGMDRERLRLLVIPPAADPAAAAVALEWAGGSATD